MSIYTASLASLAKEFDLEVAYRSTDFDRVQITVEDVARPGLQLAGYFEHYEPSRIQVIGRVEYSYIQSMHHERRLMTFDRLLAYRPPCIIYARSQKPCAELLSMAAKYDVSVLISNDNTSEFASTLIATLKHHLAPRMTRHGVLVEVHGEGMLIMGDSGVGKSEAAIELVKRGHRLIADDAVEIMKVAAHQLVGSAPALIRHYIELRGIGVINVAQLFGMGAVKDTANIDMIVNLEVWRDDYVYDRLGVDTHTTDMLGVEVPTVTIPVKPGRNVAVILEVAAMNNRQKRNGMNAAEEFTNQISRSMGL